MAWAKDAKEKNEELFPLTYCSHITKIAMLWYNLFAGGHGYFMNNTWGVDSNGAYNYTMALLFW